MINKLKTLEEVLKYIGIDSIKKIHFSDLPIDMQQIFLDYRNSCLEDNNYEDIEIIGVTKEINSELKNIEYIIYFEHIKLNLTGTYKFLESENGNVIDLLNIFTPEDYAIISQFSKFFKKLHIDIIKEKGEK